MFDLMGDLARRGRWDIFDVNLQNMSGDLAVVHTGTIKAYYLIEGGMDKIIKYLRTSTVFKLFLFFVVSIQKVP